MSEVKNKKIRFSEKLLQLLEEAEKESINMGFDLLNGIILIRKALESGQATDFWEYLTLKKGKMALDIDIPLFSILQKRKEEFKKIYEEVSKKVEENLTEDIEDDFYLVGIEPSEFIYVDEENNSTYILMEREVLEKLDQAIKYAESRKRNTVSVGDFLLQLFQEPVWEDMQELLTANSCEVQELIAIYQKVIELEEIAQSLYEEQEEVIEESSKVLQKEENAISNLLKDALKKVDSTHADILERDKEVDKIWNILLKAKKRNVILTGEPGVGKSAIIEKMANDIQSKNCPEKFYDFEIYALDINALTAGTMYRGMAEEKFLEVKKFVAQNPKVIVFIDEMHTIVGAGKAEGESLDFANALKPLLASENGMFIGATTKNEYEKFILKDGALTRRFEEVIIKEPNFEKTKKMILARVKKLSKYHNVTINANMLDFLMTSATCFNYHTKNPDRTIDALDKAMAIAEKRKQKCVTKKCVLEVFDYNLERFSKMTPEYKKATAYHEAGHFVAATMQPEMKRTTKVITVSILPGKGYEGINVIEDIPNLSYQENENYILQSIVVDLAGRIAEEKLCNETKNSGAKADLEHAYTFAIEAIKSYGIYDNVVFLEKQLGGFYSEKMQNQIVEEAKKLVLKAQMEAEKLVEEYRTLIEVVAENLLKKGYLKESEITKIIKNQ